MDLSLKDYMECVSLSLTDKPLDFYAFSRRVIFNGGYDMHEISVEDIVHLYNEEFSECDRDEVLWAFAETIDIYKFAPETPEDLCCGIFTLIILCRISAQDKDDYLNNYDKIIEMFYFSISGSNPACRCRCSPCVSRIRRNIPKLQPAALNV